MYNVNERKKEKGLANILLKFLRTNFTQKLLSSSLDSTLWKRKYKIEAKSVFQASRSEISLETNENPRETKRLGCRLIFRVELHCRKFGELNELRDDEEAAVETTKTRYFISKIAFRIP